METNFANTPIDPAAATTTESSYNNDPYGGPFVEIVYIEGSNSNSNAIQGTTL